MALNLWQAIILGLVQGLTEFLPVSSSGHLVIAQTLLGLEVDMMTFDVFVHVGTLAAVFVAFRQDIAWLLRHIRSRFTAMILIACIPAGIMGLLLDDLFSRLFASLTAVGCALVLTGILLLLSDRFNGQREIKDMKAPQALLIGLCQGFAIAPGLSRSGSTIFGALTCGLKRSEAAKFSFIVSIPVILGAGLKEAYDLLAENTAVVEWTYFVGAAVAALSGYFAIRVFLRLLEKRNMRFFSYYVWLVALAIFVSRIFA